MVDDLAYDEMSRHLHNALMALAVGDVPEARAEIAHAEAAAAAWEEQRRIESQADVRRFPTGEER